MQTSILVVDDVEAIRSFLRMVLIQVGHEKVLTAADGEEAIAKIRENEVGVVFLDINLPDRSGLSLLTWIKASYPDTKVVMCSGDARSEQTNQAISAGADDYLAKPISLESILRVLRKFGLTVSVS